MKIDSLCVAAVIMALASTSAFASSIDTELVSQSYGGNVEKVEELLKKGAHLEAIAFETWTPLTAAADQGHLSVVKQLMSAGAGVNLPDGAGNTALFYALIKGKSEVARFLMQNGAQIKDWPKRKAIVLEALKRNGDLELLPLVQSIHAGF